MNKEVLRSIGLSDSEIEVYLSLLKNGPCLASAVSSDTSLNRTHIYECLRKLMKKAIVAYVIRENRKYFSAISPSALLNYLDEQARLLEIKRKEVASVVAELEKIKKRDELVSVEVFKGIEGAKTVLNNVISVGRANKVFPYTGALFELMPIFYRNYLKRTSEKGIHRLLLMAGERRGGKIEKTPLTKLKFLPEGFNFPSSIWTYGDFVVIFIAAEELTLVRVKSKLVAKVYSQFFDELWKISKK